MNLFSFEFWLAHLRIAYYIEQPDPTSTCAFRVFRGCIYPRTSSDFWDLRILRNIARGFTAQGYGGM